ncbi:cytochrome P450 [Brasilonema sp. UFV-L1]|uniref:cytochrome P450 n=1 Tax=Brasilonema sp. UFV-L1 TaxID=2234130 RepID=UPI00145E4D71|nr:cytochrome P450 [Brasilonema sp. UFV-L1]NMG08649.1 cytochrome P450 [Brasilonema sp. UFV-L1]
MKIPSSSNPAFVEVLRFALNPISYLDANFKHLGDVFWAYIPQSTIIVGSPAAIHEVFAAGSETFDTGLNNAFGRIFFQEGSIALASGEEHVRQRQILGPVFRGERMQSCRELVCHVTQNFLNGKRKVVVEDLAETITMTTILNFTFGSVEGERYHTIARELASQLNIIGTPLKGLQLFVPFLQVSWGSWGEWQRSQKVFVEEVAAEIRERRQADVGAQDDVLSILIKEGETDKRICAQVTTMLLSGRDTTAHSMAWTLYWICAIPEIKDKVIAEIDSGKDFMSLPYLDAVIKETLRLYSPGFIGNPRVTKVPFKLLDWQLDPGTLLTICPYLVHQQEEIYPEPKTFRPERFLERQFSPYEYLPFGGGNHTCIGKALALFEIKLVIGTILSEYNVELANKRPVRPIRHGMVLGPEKYELLVERR